MSNKSFFDNLVDTQSNISVTENGALGYKTTKHALLDFLFKLSSYRNSDCITDFNEILKEGDEVSLRNLLKFLFYIRDVREGLGERNTFRKCIHELFSKKGLSFAYSPTFDICECIIEYGRADDLFAFFGTSKEEEMIEFVKNQLKKDWEGMEAKKSISLLAKWMPSANASAKLTKDYAYNFIRAFGCSEKEYRKMLSALRAYLDVIEVKTCANEWGEIDYNTVPSKANIKYKNAFIKHDEERRREYLNKLAHGDKDVKINSAVNFPHDVLHMYSESAGWDGMNTKAYDEAVEQLWKNLKELPGLKDTIVVRDDSGSMTSNVGGTNVTAYEIATALAIYCGQHCKGGYKNKLITFSNTPRYLDFNNKASLHSIYEYLNKHSEVADTNVKAVFELILRTAVTNKLSADEMPKQILILSDMEFNSGCTCIPLMDEIDAEFRKFGYKLPKLVFWNICGRTSTIPMKENENGVLLISGFSQNIMTMINNGETDPFKALITELKKERYNKIAELHFVGFGFTKVDEEEVGFVASINKKGKVNYKLTKIKKKGVKNSKPKFLK